MAASTARLDYGAMQATISPGRPNLMMDHLQLGLRHGPADGQTMHFYLSLYAISWSRDYGSGHLALLRRPAEHGGSIDLSLTDNPSLGRAYLDVLRSRRYARVDIGADPRPASFSRSPLKDRDHVRYLIGAVGLEVEARWDGLGEALFAYGPAPGAPEEQDIWSMLFEAEDAFAAVDGREVPGETFALENWVPWLGRTLNSAHVARGEIVVDRPASAEPAPDPTEVS